MKLSILLTTYNHAPYIGQALQGIADQEMTIEHEIVIADDCSEDGTRDIVRQFAHEHPERVRLILPETNLGRGGAAIFFQQLASARGEYLALLDGDDYWTEPRKLQTQIDILDEHPEHSTCFHDVQVVYEDPSRPGHRFNREPRGRLRAGRPEPVTTLADIVRGDYIATCSAVLRAPPALPDWFFEIDLVDWPLHVLSAERGDLVYLDDVMGVYRVHAGGLWSSRISLYEELEDVETIAEIYETINEHLDEQFESTIGLQVARLYEHAAINFARSGKTDLAMMCAKRSTARLPLMRRGHLWRAHSLLLSGSLFGRPLVPRR